MSDRAAARAARADASPIGSRGWPLIFLGTGLTTLAAGSLALLLPPLLERRGVGKGAIGVVVASAGIASFLTRVPAGAAYRRRRASVSIGVGAAVTTASFLLIPVVQATAVVAVLVALDGAAFALASTTAMAAVVDRRPASMSLGGLMGWFTGSIGAGYSLAAFVAGALADAIGIVPAIRAAAVVPPIAAVVMWVGLVRIRSEGVEPTDPALERPGLRGLVRSMPVGVWMAFLVALYINLVNGALHAFFPIYGLSIGLTLTQVGLVSGIHGALASVVRFGAGSVFRHVGYERVMFALVAMSAGFVILLWFPRTFLPLALTFAAMGVARGFLRVASGALAVEGSAGGPRGGGASGIYLAGLDLGNVLGPLAGGVTAELVGLRAAFPLLGATFALVFVVLAVALRRRAADGPATT